MSAKSKKPAGCDKQDGARGEKASVNLTVQASLVREAAERGVDLANLLEQAIRRELGTDSKNELASVEGEIWRRENAAAIASWNEELERNGLWSDGLRSF